MIKSILGNIWLTDCTFLSVFEETEDVYQPHCTYNPSGTNNVYSIFLTVNSVLGTVLLNFPKSFDEAGGIFAATTVHVILLVFVVIALLIFAHTADRQWPEPATTLHGTMEGITGRWGRIVTSVFVAIFCFISTISFLVVIGDQLLSLIHI